MRAKAVHDLGFGLTGAPACHVGVPVFASAGDAPLHIEARSKGSTGILFMTGSIGGEEGLQEADIIASLNKLKEKHKNVTVHLRNFMGGAVTDGSLVYNEFEAAGVNTIAEGIVASFGTVLFAAGKEREIVRFSRLMIHDARGGFSGTSNQMRAHADFMDTWSNEMAGVFSEKMNKPVADVQAEYFDGEDHWITADQAVKMGLATKQVKGAIKKAAPTAKLADAQEVFAFYETQLNNEDKSINSEMKNKGAIVAALTSVNPKLKISAESSDEVILEAITAQGTELTDVRAKLEELEQKAENELKVKAEAKVDEYIKDGKLTADKKDATVAKLVADFDGMTSILDAVPAHKSITSQLNTGDGNTVTGAFAKLQAKFEGMPYAQVVKAEGGEAYLDAYMKADKEGYDKFKAAYAELPTE